MGKKTIYMNPPLEILAAKTKGKSRREGGFSAALGDIVERYQIMLDLTALPSFSDDETFILSEAICGSVIDARKIRGLHLDVLDCASGTPEIRESLSIRLESMTPGERLALIEKIGQ